MAETPADSPLGKTPDALKERTRSVGLSDGTQIVVQKWSWLKWRELMAMVGDLAKTPMVAELSVLENERERVRSMDPEDHVAIAAAAVDLNVTPSVLKNLQALLRKSAQLTEAIVEKSAP